MEPCERYCSPYSYYEMHSHHIPPIYNNDFNNYSYPSCCVPPIDDPCHHQTHHCKKKKKSLLKSPFTALKNAIMKTTKPLRRMNSVVEPERKLKPCLRRQHSMMERNQFPQQAYMDPYPPRAPSAPPPLSTSSSHYSMRHEPFYPTQNSNCLYWNVDDRNVNVYDSIRRRSCQNQLQQQHQNFDDLYVNRARIDLERRQMESRGEGRRIIRRHSIADRGGSVQQRNAFQKCSSRDEGNLKYENPFTVRGDGQQKAPSSAIMIRRKFNVIEGEGNDEPSYQSRREMHRNHLYQSRREMQERIAQGRREVKFESTSSQYSDEKSDRESLYQSRREIVKENGLRTKSQLREHIYQSRKEAMESMAEPNYVSRRELGNTHHEPIYEHRDEGSSSKENLPNEKKEEDKSSPIEDTLTTSKHSEQSGPSYQSDETVIENPKKQIYESEENLSSSLSAGITAVMTTNLISKYDEKNENNYDNGGDQSDAGNDGDDDDEDGEHRRVFKTPYHISKIIKRTAGFEPPIDTSRTSLETHYTSQASIPLCPPNATSTPYASDTSLPTPIPNPNTIQPFPTIPRETTTTKGVFDESGGVLRDNVWNVSLHIPPGAISPGVKQEIYFTVTDPRMSEIIGGPPLDMENGETMLSPLVMCGPQGLEFLVPVTLNIPHCAGRTASLGLALKATDSEKSLHTNWDNIDLPSNTSAHTVSVKVDHF